MPSAPRRPRLAVLIDADNASPHIADGLFGEIAKIGEATVRRAYGNFAEGSKKWAEPLRRHAIAPQQLFAQTPGKNASDIALVIDAMDFLHGGRFDGFCLVSSDSDFTRLAARIREQGVDIFGFGEQKTPESFRHACRRFFYAEPFGPRRPAISRSAPHPAAVPAAPTQRPPSAATPVIRQVLSKMESVDGWVALSAVGVELATARPGYKKDFGVARLSVLIRRTDAFDIDPPEGGSGARIRPKPPAAAEATTKVKPQRKAG